MDRRLVEPLIASQAYGAAASFVPTLTTQVLQYLDPQEDDRILDIGCGDGVLTEKIACKSGRVVGLDSSRSLLNTAIDTVGSRHTNANFVEWDCRRLDGGGDIPTFLGGNSYEKVFSNAAMHWILRAEETRAAFFEGVHRVLVPGGKFVFEMGAASNVPEAHTALISIMHSSFKIPLERVRAANPWFFPSEAWMQKALEKAGFQVDKVDLDYRPTRMTSDGGSGLAGWLRLMGAPFLALLHTQQERDEAVRLICDILKDVVVRPEDGSEWLGYVRLRAIATKPKN